MHISAYAVSKLSYNAVDVLFSKALYSMTDITQAVAATAMRAPSKKH